jgi:hypothetical protein
MGDWLTNFAFSGKPKRPEAAQKTARLYIGIITLRVAAEGAAIPGPSGMLVSSGCFSQFMVRIGSSRG